MAELSYTNTITIAGPMEPITSELLPVTAADAPPIVQPLDIVEGTEVRTKVRLGAIIGSLYLVLFVAALDQTIVATAIPTITADLNSASGYVWIGSAYLLANAGASPIWARFSDIWGRKPALLGSVALFAVGSTLAAASTSMSMLIAARALQGVAGGALMQLVIITVSDLFSVRQRSMYNALMGVIWAVAGGTGPLIGGALSQLASWRWCFWINLPICGLAFVLLLFFLDVHNPRTKFRDGIMAVDWLGTISILAVTLLVLLGLDFGGVIFPWTSPKVLCLIIMGTLTLGFFVYTERRLARYPLMPLGIFKDLSTSAICFVAFAHNMVAIGTEFYLPLYFQSVEQASPLRSGILILPMLIMESVSDVSSGFFIHKTGRYREIIWVGTAVMTLGLGLCISFQGDTALGKAFAYEIVAGVGIAMLFQAPPLAMQNNVSQEETATAISTFGFLRTSAGSMSIVLGGVVFQNSMAKRQSALAVAGLSESVLTALSGDQAAANVNVIQLIEDPVKRQVVQDAFAWSISNIFIMYTCVSGVSMLVSAFIKHKTLRTEHTETRTGIENMKGRDASTT
ncbi:MFS drug transporter [Xylariales sp. PMI_506]|nr:MFS drug transporter [Xylariales sp. PMI_506]